MKKALLILISLFLLPVISLAKEPPNLRLAINKVIHYYESGEYGRDVRVIIDNAKKYLQQRIDANQKAAHKKKLAIVFDTDDTLLCCYPVEKQFGWGGSDFGLIRNMQKQGKIPANPIVAELYKMAQDNNVAIFIVTSRMYDVKNSTVRNLMEQGYKGWTKLYMRSKQAKDIPTKAWKMMIRKHITESGYDIAINIGDQNTDLGVYADKNIKLPNPQYLW